MGMRRTYVLRPWTVHLLDAMSLTSGEDKGMIVDRGIVYAYVVRKILPPELVRAVEEAADRIMTQREEP
ncbi:MAG: hypothetical protein PWQ62_1240 [Candidatus Methanomethylophilaceae archaeon]|nr:hypothetical protein [Candidatus Methanomethylophilaceae archaeon]